MKITSTKFSGLKIFQTKSYKDTRGFFKENFKNKLLKNKRFVFACTSSSKKTLLEGFIYKLSIRKKNMFLY